MKSIKIIVLSLIGLLTLGLASAYVDPGRCNVGPCHDSSYNQYAMPDLPAFDFIPPSWFRPTSLDNASESANYWIDQVLPYLDSKSASRYVVIPTMGMVVPIVEIGYGSDDFNRMRQGQDIDINKYLRNGVVRFPHSSVPGAPGNMFIFGHSNGLASWAGNYNAVFAKIMGLEAGSDQVRVFEKNPSGTFELYKYQVVESYGTSPSNVNVMLWDGEGSDITLSACTNKLGGRWIIKGTLLDKWSDIDPHLRNRIDFAIKKISWMRDQQQTADIVHLFKLLDNIKAGGLVDTEYKELIAEYIQTELARIMPG